MNRYSRLNAVFVLLLCVASLASPQPRKVSPQIRSFESADHAVTFQYSYPLVLYQKDTASCQDYLPACQADQDTTTPIACLGYGGHAYEGYNFTSATFSLGILSSAKDETACYDLPGTKTGDEKINGVTYRSSQDGDAGMGHYMNAFIYRAFHGGHCYAAVLRIATTAFGNYDPGTVKEFKPADEQKVRRKLKQALETLHFLDPSSRFQNPPKWYSP
jgi:hypothetical protein